MRLPIPLLAPAALALALVSCGPSPGGSCNTDGYVCSGSDAALECRDSEWRELPCRGPSGCSVDAQDIVHCDVQRSLANDPCAQEHEGTSVCAASAAALLECRGGAWLQAKPCPNTPCSATASGFTCD